MEGQRLVNLSLTNDAERSRAILLERNNNDSDAVDYVDEYNEQEGKETINQLYVLYYIKVKMCFLFDIVKYWPPNNNIYSSI
jgi:hypothetical protein